MKLDNQRNYRVRENRLRDAIALKEPDRVPIVPLFGFFSCYYTGTTLREAYESPDKALSAWRSTINDFEPDATFHVNFANHGMDEVLAGLSHYATQYRGDRFRENHSFPFIHSEWIIEKEHDELLSGPTEFFFRKLLLRTAGVPSDSDNFHLVLTSSPEQIWPFVLTDSAYSNTHMELEAIFNGSKKQEQWVTSYTSLAEELIEAGFPSIKEQTVSAPYDFVTDFLQKASGTASDLLVQPDKLKRVTDELTPFMSTVGIRGAMASQNSRVHISVKNKMDKHVSSNHFKNFCWPSMQRLICELVKGGCNPYVHFQGDYKPWLDIIKDVPAGSCIYHFEDTDIFEAKKKLDHTVCIMGNFPNSMLATGTVEQVREQTKRLIDVCGDGGGYIMSSASHIDHAKPENVAAWIDTTKEYGTYH